MATINAATEHFLKLASLQPIATQGAYCASKAGFSMYLDSARIELKRKGITITDILPGYLKTDIVEGVDIGKLPFAIPVEQAAREMARLIGKGVKSGVVPAFPWKLVRPFLGHLPERFARV
jgi:short-subunit dehydrogenase